MLLQPTLSETWKTYSVLIKNGKSLLMIKEPLTMLTPYLFFLWHWHKWKNFSWINCYQTGFVRKHQTNNYLSFCDKLINSYALPTIFWKWLIWIVINFGVSCDHIWEVVLQWQCFFPLPLIKVEFNVTLVHNCVSITSFLCDLFL